MTTRKGLGKGLAALISDAEPTVDAGHSVLDIPVANIDANPFQPRQVFNEAAIEELKQSIQAQGVLQPVLVRKNGDRFQLIVGERRWRASKAAGLTVIPALVRESATDEEMLELALLENVQRQDLNPVELAQALQRMQTTCKLTQEAVAEKLGVSRAHVANTLRLLKLPKIIQDALADGRITSGHARALIAISDDGEQRKLFERFLVDGRPTVREAENLTRNATGKTKKPRLSNEWDTRQQLEIRKIEDRLRKITSTRVKIKPRGHGGILEIQFFNPDDLQRILDFFER
jgi:ParB family transcriptional regulator, chromosome partitioning protein